MKTQQLWQIPRKLVVLESKRGREPIQMMTKLLCPRCSVIITRTVPVISPQFQALRWGPWSPGPAPSWWRGPGPWWRRRWSSTRSSSSLASTAVSGGLSRGGGGWRSPVTVEECPGNLLFEQNQFYHDNENGFGFFHWLCKNVTRFLVIGVDSCNIFVFK